MCKHEETGKISTKSLNGRLNVAVRGEKLAQQRLCEAEADVEVKHWEKRRIRILLFL